MARILETLPDDTPVGLVTYSDAVEVHELQGPLGAQLWRIPISLAVAEAPEIHAMLGIAPHHTAAEPSVPAHQLAQDAGWQEQLATASAFGVQAHPGGYEGLRGGEQGTLGKFDGPPGAPIGSVPDAGPPNFGAPPPGAGPPSTGGFPPPQQMPTGYAPLHSFQPSAAGDQSGHPPLPAGYHVQHSPHASRPHATDAGPGAPPHDGPTCTVAAECSREAARTRFFRRAKDFDIYQAMEARKMACVTAVTAEPGAVAPGPAGPGAEVLGAAGPGSAGPVGTTPPGSRGGWGQPQPGPPRRRLAATAAAAAAAAMQAGVEAGAEEGKRAARCTGSALGAAVSLLDACISDAARVLLFTGGPSVGGDGAIVGPELIEPLRSHRDIQEGAKAAARQRVARHYDKIAERAAERGHAIDLICCSLEETGLHEMSSCAERTGGVALLAETFGAPHLIDSLSRLFARDPRGGLQLGYGACVQLRTTRECGGVKLLCGSGGSDRRAAPVVQAAEAGDSRTFSWRVGALNCHTCAALTLERGDDTLGGPREWHLIQLATSYKDAAGARRTRVTTLRLPRLMQPVPARQLLPALDQQAAAALLVRQVVERAAHGAAPSDMIKTIDRQLIKIMRALCDFRPGDPATVMLPPQAAQLPGLIFNLRRCPAVRTTGLSPDETAYFRLLASSLSVFATLVLVQPTLVAYALGSPPQPIPLEPAAMAPDRTLLLDTFLQVYPCARRALSCAMSPKSAGGHCQRDRPVSHPHPAPVLTPPAPSPPRSLSATARTSPHGAPRLTLPGTSSLVRSSPAHAMRAPRLPRADSRHPSSLSVNNTRRRHVI